MFLGKGKDASEAWGKAGEDHREFPRMALKTLVTVTAGRREAHCKLHDLSLGGLAFIAPWRLEPNDAVSLVLPAPETGKKPPPPANIDARVCRVVASQKYPGSWQTGVRFSSLDAPSLEVVKLWFSFFGESPEKRRK